MVGGRDGVRRSSQSGLMAADRLEEITAQAHAMVAAGRGKDLLLMPGWWYVISAESFLDRDSKMPDILELAPRITCPVLYLRGDQESPGNYPAEAFRDRSGGPCEVDIIPNCDHFYRGREDAVIERVTAWLRRTLPPAPAS
jgi:pimeloyl-ACP methyl ester carboxylesterase